MNNNYKDYDSELFKRGFKCDFSKFDLLPDLVSNGFIIIRNVLGDSQIKEYRKIFEDLYAKEGSLAGTELSQMVGIRRLANLINKSELFKQIYLNRILLTTVLFILQKPFKLGSLNGHDPLKGGGLQEFHSDWKYPFDGNNYVVNSIWMLDNFHINNGATRVIPKSHTIKQSIDELIENKLDDHPEQVFLEGRAGDLAIFNSHLWHGSYINKSGEKRRAYHCYFVARQFPQQTNQRRYLDEDVKSEMDPVSRYILDID